MGAVTDAFLSCRIYLPKRQSDRVRERIFHMLARCVHGIAAGLGRAGASPALPHEQQEPRPLSAIALAGTAAVSWTLQQDLTTRGGLTHDATTLAP